MKKIYSFLLLLPFIVSSQNVVFGDPQMANNIISSNPLLDANNDGFIQVSEAQAATELTVLGSLMSNDISGLEAFVNITSLNWQLAAPDVNLNLNFAPNLSFIDLNHTHSLQSLDVSALTHISHLDIGNNNFTSVNLAASASTLEWLNVEYCYFLVIDFNDFPNLKYLNTRERQITNSDFTQLTQLEHLICRSTSIATINVNGLSNLKTLDVDGNLLPTIDTSTLVALETLRCGNNLLTSLTLTNTALRTLACNNNNISSLDLNNLSNLIELSASSCGLTTIDLSPCPGLESLSLSNNLLTSLDISMLPALKKLDCSSNTIGSIDISNQPNLEYLYCSYCGLTALDVTATPLLKELWCSNNSLTALDTSGLLSLNFLNCEYNQLSALDLAGASQLREARVSGNLFTSLDFSALNNGEPLTMGTYGFADCPLLTVVNLKNAAETFMFHANPEWLLNCPSLQYICCNEDNISMISQYLNSMGGTGITYNSYCSFEPGGTYNSITGTITIDLDNNGCGTGDMHFPGIRVDFSDGGTQGATFTNANGNFTFFNQAGTFTLTPQLNNPLFTVTPAEAILTFNTLDGSTQSQNFCVTPNGVQKDLRINIIPTAPLRPGFDVSYMIIYTNAGNQVQSGSVSFTFNDGTLDFVAALPSAISQSGGTIGWGFTNLQPFESRVIELTLNVNSPVETPAVNIGDMFDFTALILPTQDDINPSDNTHTLSDIAVGSFDPNDKTCVEGETITPSMVGEYLNYVIRFQNSGTFYAENVVVTDIIDTNKFDISTLQLTASSHPHVTRITGNKVEFIFEGINLPAEQDDEPGSHGFVAFKIKTLPNLVLNDVVENTADIFFDFNAPITTNTTSTTVSNLGVGEADNLKVSMTPNPVRNILTILAEDDIQAVQVFDLQGRLLQTRLDNDTHSAIDFSDKTTGVYFVKVTTEKGMKTQKIIKE